MLRAAIDPLVTTYRRLKDINFLITWSFLQGYVFYIWTKRVWQDDILFWKNLFCEKKTDSPVVSVVFKVIHDHNSFQLWLY